MTMTLPQTQNELALERKKQHDKTLRRALRTLVFIRENGVCFGSQRDFFAKNDKTKVAAAKALCLQCPIKEQCLLYACEFERHGIWGGMTKAQRKYERERRHITFVDIYSRNLGKPTQGLMDLSSTEASMS
jgi:hypothetical protein